MNPNPNIGTINPPPQLQPIAGKSGAEGLGYFLSLIFNLIVSVSAVIFLFMIVFGGVQWLTSGGDKEKVASAKKKISAAVIGLLVVSLAAVGAQTVGSILGFNIFGLGNPFPGSGQGPN